MWWIVAGTRPELIKLGPLFRALQAPYQLILTGQHTSLIKGIPLPRETLRLELPSHNEPLAYVEACDKALLRCPDTPDGVIVQGDTASALAGARFAHRRQIPLAHVEAGLRTYADDPWPEEAFRVEIDRLADYKFAPTDQAYANLIAEGLSRQCSVTGNTCVDALQGVYRDDLRSGLLLTLHRRESFGEPMREILAGLRGYQGPVTWPVHPNPEVVKVARATRLQTTAPMDRAAFLHTLRRSKLVVTDSGGVIEEACTLGIPCVIARDHSERMEAVHAGSAVLAGRTSQGIYDGLQWALQAQIEPSSAFGDGSAGSQIAALLPTL